MKLYHSITISDMVSMIIASQISDVQVSLMYLFCVCLFYRSQDTLKFF